MSEPIGPGEALERRQRRRRTLILSLLMIAGGIIGYALVLAGDVGPGFHQGTLSAWAAITLALGWLVSVIGGSIWYKRHIDEIDQAAQIWGIAAAGSVVLILYPAWYLLWRGQLVGEPNAHVIFATLYVVMIGAYLSKKFR
ncbi:MAG TPA: hypothetical protein VIT38_15015 [Allosphingosinicella sp.]